MLHKSQSISARLSADDYAYLMSIDRNGAITQSEKVRELIAMARESVGMRDFARSYVASSEALLPIKARCADEGGRSLLVEALLELLAEGVAAVQASADEKALTPALERKALPAIDAFLEKMLLLLQEEPRVIEPRSAQRIKKRLNVLPSK